MTIADIMLDHPACKTRLRRKNWPVGYFFIPTNKSATRNGDWYGLTNKSFDNGLVGKMEILQGTENDWEVCEGSKKLKEEDRI